MLDKAIRIAAYEFEGERDKGGVPYIMHCLHVMNTVKHLGEQAMIVGVLHDLIEDTHWTSDMLIDEGFDEVTVQLIINVTHLENEEYMDYIKRTALHPITRSVKMGDLRHNSDVHRMKGLREKDHRRIDKYFEAYAYLRDFK